MTIRFTCPECSSEMKIKDELSGTAARCPKCKTKFVVPAAGKPGKVSAAKGADLSPGDSAHLSDEFTPDQTVVRTATGASTSKSRRTDHGPADEFDHSLRSTGKDHQIPVEFDPAETLRLDDSDDAIPTNFSRTAALSDSDDTISTSLKPSATAQVDDPVPSQTASSDSVEMLRVVDSYDEIDVSEIARATESHHSGPSSSEPVAVSDVEDLDSPPLMVSHPILAMTSVFVAKEYAVHEERVPSPVLSAKDAKPSRPSSGGIAFDPAKFLASDRPKSIPEFTPPSAERREVTAPDSDHYEIAPREFERREPERKPAIPDFSPLGDTDSGFQSRPTDRPFNRPTPAVKSSTPRPQPEKIDLATAAKMMKKAIKDNQTEEAHQRELDAKAGFDFAGLFAEIGWKGVGIALGSILACWGLYFMANRAFSNAMRLPKMGYVTGVVKLNGTPLSGAIVNFAPMEDAFEGTKRERIRTSVGVSDDQGRFRMMYMPAEKIEGVAAGRCRVWVTHFGANGRSDVPPEWGEYASVVREVTAGKQPAPVEINMESRTR